MSNRKSFVKGSIAGALLTSLLHSYPNVKAVFHGHDHSLDAAHIGGNWGTSYKGYRIVEVDENEPNFNNRLLLI